MWQMRGSPPAPRSGKNLLPHIQGHALPVTQRGLGTKAQGRTTQGPVCCRACWLGRGFVGAELYSTSPCPQSCSALPFPDPYLQSKSCPPNSILACMSTRPDAVQLERPGGVLAVTMQEQVGSYSCYFFTVATDVERLHPEHLRSWVGCREFVG